jgi:hypothetical protein
MGIKFLIGLVATVVLGAVVAKQNETAGGFVFLVGLVLTCIWSFSK